MISVAPGGPERTDPSYAPAGSHRPAAQHLTQQGIGGSDRRALVLDCFEQVLSIGPTLAQSDHGIDRVHLDLIQHGLAAPGDPSIVMPEANWPLCHRASR